MSLDEGPVGRRVRRARRRAGVSKPKYTPPVRGENSAEKARTGVGSSQAREFGAATGSFVPSTLKTPKPRRIQSPDATELNAASAKDKFRIIATASQQREGTEAWQGRRERIRSRAADLAPVDSRERVRLLNRSQGAETTARESVMPAARSGYQQTQDYLNERDTLIGKGAHQIGEAGHVAGQVGLGLGRAAVEGAMGQVYGANQRRVGFGSNAERISGGPVGKAAGAAARDYVEQIALGPDATAFIMGGGGGKNISKIGAAFDVAMAGAGLAGGGGGAAAAFHGFGRLGGRGAGRAGRDFLEGGRAIERGALKSGKRPRVFEVDVHDDYVNNNMEVPTRTAIVYNRKTGKMLVQKEGTGQGVWHSGLIRAWEDQVNKGRRPSQREAFSGIDDAHEVISVVYHPPRAGSTPSREYPGGVEIYAELDRIPPMLVRNLRKRYPGIPLLGYNNKTYEMVGLPNLKGKAQEGAVPFSRSYYGSDLITGNSDDLQWRIPPGEPAGAGPRVSTQDRPPRISDPNTLLGPGEEGFDVSGDVPVPTANDFYGEAWKRPSAPITKPEHVWALLDDVKNGKIGPDSFNRQIDGIQMPEDEYSAAIKDYAENWIEEITAKIDSPEGMTPEEINRALDFPLIPPEARDGIYYYWSEKHYSRPSQIAGTNKDIMDQIDKGLLVREDLERYVRGLPPSRRDALLDYFDQVNEGRPHTDFEGKLTDEYFQGLGYEDGDDALRAAEDYRIRQIDEMVDAIRGGMTRSQLEAAMKQEGLNDDVRKYLREVHVLIQKDRADPKGIIPMPGSDKGRVSDGLQQSFGPKDQWPMEEIELGVRAYNILKRMGVKTVGDFLRLRPSDLMKGKHGNFGVKSLEDVAVARKEWGRPFTTPELDELGIDAHPGINRPSEPLPPRGRRPGDLTPSQADELNRTAHKMSDAVDAKDNEAFLAEIKNLIDNDDMPSDLIETELQTWDLTDAEKAQVEDWLANRGKKRGGMTEAELKEAQEDLGLSDEEMDSIIDDYEYMMKDDELRNIVLGEGVGTPPSGEKPPTAVGGAGGEEPPDEPPTTFGWDDEDFPEYIDWTEAVEEQMTPDEIARARRTNKFLEFMNIPRTAKSTLDWSHPMRQSIVMMGAFPKEWAQAWGPMMKAAKDPVAAEAMWKRMQELPQHEQAKRFGVRFNDLEEDITNREESLAGLRYMHKIWGVKGSARAYTTFGNVSSQAAWDNMIRLAKSKGYNTAGYSAESKKLLEDIAKFVNLANGRGNLKGYGNTLAAINTLFFSPRLIHSRLQLLNPLMYTGVKGTNYRGLHPLVKKRALMGAGALAGEIAVVSAMAWQAGEMLGIKVQAEVDPRSSDFGKIRVGDTRIDLSGGIAAYMTLISRVTPTGHDGFKPRFKTKNQHDQVEITGAGLGKRSPWEIATDFVENKVSPLPAAVIDAWKQERGVGQPYDPKMVPVDLLAPINWTNVVEQRNNPAAAAATAALGFVGVGVDTYKTTGERTLNARESAEKKTKDAVQDELPLAKRRGWKQVPPHIVKAITLREKVEARLQVLEREQKGAKNAQVPEGEQLKLQPRQRYMAVINALRDYEPRFNYKSAVAKAKNLSEKGLEREQDRLRRVFYGGTLERWHG